MQVSFHASVGGSPRAPASPRRRQKPAWAETLTAGPQLHRTSSKGSQALQLARSMGQAGGCQNFEIKFEI